MPRQKGIFKIEGTLDDVSFYKRKNVYMAGKKGGVSAKRIKTDPKFKRTRENGSEFGIVANAGKLLRDASFVLTRKVMDGELGSRLTSVLAQVKNADTTSVRGERQVYKGLATESGKNMLRGFDFNERSGIRSVLYVPYALDTVTGEIEIPQIVAAENLNYPLGATHVCFRAGYLNLDFEDGVSALSLSPEQMLPLNLDQVDVVLTPSTVPVGTGTKMYFLLIEFYQQVNQDFYVLRNGNHNVLTLIDVV